MTINNADHHSMSKNEQTLLEKCYCDAELLIYSGHENDEACTSFCIFLLQISTQKINFSFKRPYPEHCFLLLKEANY